LFVIIEILGVVAKLCLAMNRGIKQLEIYYSYLQSYSAGPTREMELAHHSNNQVSLIEKNIVSFDNSDFKISVKLFLEISYCL